MLPHLKILYHIESSFDTLALVSSGKIYVPNYLWLEEGKMITLAEHTKFLFVMVYSRNLISAIKINKKAINLW